MELFSSKHPGGDHGPFWMPARHFSCQRGKMCSSSVEEDYGKMHFCTAVLLMPSAAPHLRAQGSNASACGKNIAGLACSTCLHCHYFASSGLERLGIHRSVACCFCRMGVERLCSWYAAVKRSSGRTLLPNSLGKSIFRIRIKIHCSLTKCKIVFASFHKVKHWTNPNKARNYFQ